MVKHVPLEGNNSKTNPTRGPHQTSYGPNMTTCQRLQDDAPFSLAGTVGTSNFNVSGLLMQELKMMVALAEASDSLRATLGTSARNLRR